MQNDSSEVIFLQQNNRWMEQTATVCIDSSSVNVFKNRLDETWEDMGTYSWKATSLINYKYKYK